MLDQIFFSKTELKASFREFHSRKRADAFLVDTRGEPSLISLIQNHEAILSCAMKAIQSGQFQVGPATPHLIQTDKLRLIHHFNWLDTFLMFHLARSFAKLTESKLSDAVFSFRIGKSAAGALSKLKSFLKLSKLETFIIKRDISNFGESMAHSHLKSDFVRFGAPSPALQNFFSQFCGFKLQSGACLIENSVGLPGGHYLQLVCGNLYLAELDQELSGLRGGFFVRFGDDILFASRESELTKKARERIETFLSGRGLLASPTKRLDIVLRDLSRGNRGSQGEIRDFEAASNFEYLGSQVFWNGEIAIPAKKLRAFRSDLKRRIRSAIQNAPSEISHAQRLELAVVAAQNAVREVSSVTGQTKALRSLLKEAHNEEQLKALDRWLELTVLKYALKKGIKKGNFRGNSPANLRTLGLPSLLHQRRISGAA